LIGITYFYTILFLPDSNDIETNMM
jgi:hypothetical protein